MMNEQSDVILYGMSTSVHPAIIGFVLNNRRECNKRIWNVVDTLLKSPKWGSALYLELLETCIGKAAAEEFVEHYNEYSALPSSRNILVGAEVPTTIAQSVQYAQVFNLCFILNEDRNFKYPDFPASIDYTLQFIKNCTPEVRLFGLELLLSLDILKVLGST
jgi:hypothetical protein